MSNPFKQTDNSVAQATILNTLSAIGGELIETAQTPEERRAAILDVWSTMRGAVVHGAPTEIVPTAAPGSMVQPEPAPAAPEPAPTTDGAPEQPPAQTDGAPNTADSTASRPRTRRPRRQAAPRTSDATNGAQTDDKPAASTRARRTGGKRKPTPDAVLKLRDKLATKAAVNSARADLVSKGTAESEIETKIADRFIKAAWRQAARDRLVPFADCPRFALRGIDDPVARALFDGDGAPAASTGNGGARKTGGKRKGAQQTDDNAPEQPPAQTDGAPTNPAPTVLLTPGDDGKVEATCEKCGQTKRTASKRAIAGKPFTCFDCTPMGRKKAEERKAEEEKARKAEERKAARAARRNANKTASNLTKPDGNGKGAVVASKKANGEKTGNGKGAPKGKANGAQAAASSKPESNGKPAGKGAREALAARKAAANGAPKGKANGNGARKGKAAQTDDGAADSSKEADRCNEVFVGNRCTKPKGHGGDHVYVNGR